MAEHIPINRIARLGENGIYVKHTDDWKSDTLMDFIHRDEYYLFAVLIDGTANVMVDFRNISLGAGQGIILSPGQVHLPKIGREIPTAWSLFVAADLLPDSVMDRIERYSLSTHPLRFTPAVLRDLSSLFDILKRNVDSFELSRNLASAVVRMFCGSMTSGKNDVLDRYIILSLRFKRLVETQSIVEKRPAEYASRLHVSRVYLNEAIRTTTGMSAGKYIRNHIILKAMESEKEQYDMDDRGRLLNIADRSHRYCRMACVA